MLAKHWELWGNDAVATYGLAHLLVLKMPNRINIPFYWIFCSNQTLKVQNVKGTLKTVEPYKLPKKVLSELICVKEEKWTLREINLVKLC